MSELVEWARKVAEELMADELPRRWKHVQAVGTKAESLAPAFGDSAEIVAAAAWLHDIGYVEALQDTGFHPIDGGRYLRSIGTDDRLSCLVANHSGAAREATLRCLDTEMAEFPDDKSDERAAVWYCDMTTSPVGKPISFSERLAEIWERYGPDHTVPKAISASADDIRRCIAVVKERAVRVGINPGQLD